MHFFYLDETGCTGENIEDDTQQPIFVLGGISVRDEGWSKTFEDFYALVSAFFGNSMPEDFEVHASALLSPDGDGHFAGNSRQKRSQLAMDIIKLVRNRKHKVHFIGIDKRLLNKNVSGDEHAIVNTKVPYLLAYNYMISYTDKLCKEKLGRSARGLIIADRKPEFEDRISEIVHARRYTSLKSARLKWVVEFSYPIDSHRHPMVQISDLIVYLIRKFLELDNGYRPEWSDSAKQFFAECYSMITECVVWQSVIDAPSKSEEKAHLLLETCRSIHSTRWRSRYGL